MDIKITGLDQLQRKLDKLAKASDPHAMASRMRASRCPVHGKMPTNVRVSGDKVTGEFCCERARDLATKQATDAITSALG